VGLCDVVQDLAGRRAPGEGVGVALLTLPEIEWVTEPDVVGYGWLPLTAPASGPSWRRASLALLTSREYQAFALAFLLVLSAAINKYVYMSRIPSLRAGIPTATPSSSFSAPISRGICGRRLLTAFYCANRPMSRPDQKRHLLYGASALRVFAATSTSLLAVPAQEVVGSVVVLVPLYLTGLAPPAQFPRCVEHPLEVPAGVADLRAVDS
jgi:hypothetical protein